jgi:hypothetical protein
MSKGQEWKPVSLRTNYSVFDEWSIQELESEHGFQWADVDEFWVKWGQLGIKLNCGRRIDAGEGDFGANISQMMKRPSSQLIHYDYHFETENQ